MAEKQSPAIQVGDDVLRTLKIDVSDRKSFRNTVKKVGREPNMVDETKATTYMSFIKDLILFKTDTDIIKFSQHQYRTDNKEDINYIENHSAFNDGIWKGKFPAHVVKKFESDKREIHRDIESFSNPE
jgi:hypothetical protein